MFISKPDSNIIEIFEEKKYNLCYFSTAVRLGYNYYSLDCIKGVVDLKQLKIF